LVFYVVGAIGNLPLCQAGDLAR